MKYGFGNFAITQLGKKFQSHAQSVLHTEADNNFLSINSSKMNETLYFTDFTTADFSVKNQISDLASVKTKSDF